MLSLSPFEYENPRMLVHTGIGTLIVLPARQPVTATGNNGNLARVRDRECLRRGDVPVDGSCTNGRRSPPFSGPP